jgi:hypothetical protein
MCGQVTEHMAGWHSLSLGGQGSTYEVSSLFLLLLAVPENFVPTRSCHFRVFFFFRKASYGLNINPLKAERNCVIKA